MTIKKRLFNQGVKGLIFTVVLFLLVYYFANRFVTQSQWAVIIALVTSLLVVFTWTLIPVFKRKQFFAKTLLLGELTQEKPYGIECEMASDWIYGTGYTDGCGQMMAWKPKADSIILHLFCSSRKGSIKLDWQVIRQLIIYTNSPAMVELIIDDSDFWLLLPYDFEEFDIPDSVSVLRKFDLEAKQESNNV